MEYIRPDDLHHVHPDTLYYLRDQMRAELRLMDQILEGQYESVCKMCQSLGYGYTDIPEDWAYVAGEGDFLLCNNCLGKWPAANLELPELTRELEI